jgi:hypothetical protein
MEGLTTYVQTVFTRHGLSKILPLTKYTTPIVPPRYGDGPENK